MSASPPREGEADADIGHDSGASNAEAQHSADQGADGDEHGQEMGSFYEVDVKEQDRWLPIANVARIMKTALPDNAKIAKEAKECMQECVSEFISFITSEAAEKCQLEKRKTVNGEDILFAMTSLGFENYGEALKIYLARYRESTAIRATDHSHSHQNSATSGHPFTMAKSHPSQAAARSASGSFTGSTTSAFLEGPPVALASHNSNGAAMDQPMDSSENDSPGSDVVQGNLQYVNTGVGAEGGVVAAATVMVDVEGTGLAGDAYHGGFGTHVNPGLY